MSENEKEKSLVAAAKELGAVEMGDNGLPKGWKDTKTIKQALGDGKVKFHPELPRIEWAQLVGQEFIIQKAIIIPDWDGQFGTSDFPLLKVQLPDGREMTTLGSGIAIIKQIKKLLDKRLLPVRVVLTKVPPSDYYNLDYPG